jgi:XTP/dITP diphosphohydrolase
MRELMSVVGGRPLLIATRNAGKLRELRALFAGFGYEAIDLDVAGVPETSAEDELEVFDTFEENAIAKASYFHDLTGLPTVADDSGLSVDALGGAPGVRSKRFAGASGPEDAVVAANNAKLQLALSGSANRTASFVCAAAFVHRPGTVVARGEAPGSITTQPTGQGGFGYDPYFLSDELGVTFAQASVAEKQLVSHRGRAFQALLEKLESAGLIARKTVAPPR